MNLATFGRAQHANAIAKDSAIRLAQANKNAERMQENKDREALMERARMLEQSKMDQLLARLASEERRQTEALKAQDLMKKEELVARGLMRKKRRYKTGIGWHDVYE